MNIGAVESFAKMMRRRLSMHCFGSLLLITIFSASGTAHAIGVGAADVRSALGEKLEISIPVFSVSNPDGLVVSANTDMFGGDPDRVLTASLDKANSQLTVIVSSHWPLIEPYVQFELILQDGAVIQQKDVVVLLEYKPNVSVTDPLRGRSISAQPPIAPVVQISRLPRNNASANSGPSSSVTPSSESLMGPYDVAEAGRIPAQFGAVLNGQSLWRVARRINQAMGVSVEQMMVALYEANPNAFLTDSVDSLAAGSYLNIPAPEMVRQRSEVEAEQWLKSPASRANLQTSQSQNEVAASPEPLPSEAPQEPSFRIGSNSELDAELTNSPIVDASSDNNVRSQGAIDVEDEGQVIASLSKTVADLMRDQIDSEQRIQSLESRLESVETTLDNVGLPETVSNQQLSAIEQPQADASFSSIAQIDSATRVVQPSDESSGGKWLWLLLLLLPLAFWQLFTLYNKQTKRTKRLFAGLTSASEKEPEAETKKGAVSASPGFEEYQSNIDYSSLESHKSQASADDADDVEGVSYHEFDQDLVLDEEFEDDAYENNKSISVIEEDPAILEAPNKSFLFEAGNITPFPRESDLNPQKKDELFKDLDELIAEERYAEVRDLLDLLRGKQLDEANYHFQRLRLLLEENDEHGFYEYFNLVENKFQDVDGDLKMDLANLVSRLNQN
jgi:FimV-like protein